jgi:transposase
MTLSWCGSALADEVAQLGPLALWFPLLDQLGIAGIIERHCPSDPQCEFSHGQVLSLLLAARLSQPTALSNVATWAERSGADILWDIPADKLNDDRLGRALDALFPHRHSILASVTDQALRLVKLQPHRIHFDPTHLIFYGSYHGSHARPVVPLDELRGDEHMPAAQIRHGYLSKYRMTQVGVSALVDELGALPLFHECLDGNRNGFTAVREQYQLLRQHVPLPDELLMVSDRGTFSAEHVARLQRNGHAVLCSVPWNDYRALYAEHAAHLHWQTASFLSIEQRRRRDGNSSLPREDYQLAVLKHQLLDPDDGTAIPCRVLFVRSSADAKQARQRRADNIAKIRAGLEKIAAKVARAHPRSDPASIARQVVRLFGKKAAAKYFRWELTPLSAAEQASATPIGRGFKRPSHRFTFTFDASAAAADAEHDGLAALVTTAPLRRSADDLFTQFKQQNFLELLHHQWKTPLAVRPVFLKSPERVESLVCLLQIALQVFQVLERRYRQTLAADAPLSEQRMTAESLVRAFRGYGVLVRPIACGQTVHATRLTAQQRRILDQLSLPTPAAILALRLRPPPAV